MKRGFLSQKGSGVGRGAKEKQVSNALNLEVVKDGVVPSITISYDNTQKDLNDDPVAMKGTTLAGNTPHKSSYANVIGESSKKVVNIRTLFTPGGNEIDVVVSMESIRAISERFVNTAYGFFLGKRVAYPVVANYVRNTWGKFGFVKSMINSSTGLFSFQFRSTDGLNSMIENGPQFTRNHPLIPRKWNPNVDLLKEDVGNVLVWVKLYGVPVTTFSKDGLSFIATKLGTPLMLDSYTSDMCLQSWGMSSYARVMIKLWANVELKDNLVVDMLKIIGRGIIHVLFVLNMNGNPLGVRVVSCVNRFVFIDGQAILVDEAGNLLKKVECLGDYDSEDEVASVENDMTCSLASERVSFSTQSLLEQWRDSYGNGDFDEDLYDDDMYEGQDLPQEIQAICDNLDIRVRCRKKK
ncbi:putative reverse transcriptase domain-containing protein [Tanacetum coccineum]